MSSSKQINVLIPSGAGAPGFAGIQECLREDSKIRIISGDTNQNAYGKALSDRFVHMPPSNSDEFIDKLIEVCEEEEIHVGLPITTRELWPISSNIDRLKKYSTKWLISKYKALEIANDKGRLHQFAQELNIPVPMGKVCKSREELMGYAQSQFERTERLFFKPTKGNGSRGIGLITREVEPVANEKMDVVSRTLDEWEKRIPEVLETSVLVAEYLVGKEYSVDVLMNEGIAIAIVPRSRDKMVSGISVSGTFVENHEIIENSKRLLEALCLHGPIGVQWREDQNGKAKLLEINPRLQGTTSTLRHAGINIPLAAVHSALNLPFDLSNEIKWGNSFTRHWKDVFL